jgi:hypothetical protein
MFKIKKRRLIKKDEAQLFLLGGVVMTIAIISLGIVSVSLSDIGKSIDTRSFILSDFQNVRKEFGIALKDNIQGLLNYDEDNVKNMVESVFNDIRDIFIFTMGTHGLYFNAEYDDMTKTGGNLDGLIAHLSLSNGDEYISEEVRYYLS